MPRPNWSPTAKKARPRIRSNPERRSICAMTHPRRERFIYTSIKIRAVIATVFILFLLPSPREVSARTIHYPDSYYDEILKRVESLVEKNNRKKTDFWMARYLGAVTVDPGTQKSAKDLKAL